MFVRYEGYVEPLKFQMLFAVRSCVTSAVSIFLHCITNASISLKLHKTLMWIITGQLKERQLCEQSRRTFMSHVEPAAD